MTAMMSMSCDCGAYLFRIKFSPEGLIVVCTACKAVVGTLVDTTKGGIQ